MWLVAWLGKVAATLIGGPGIVTIGDPAAPAPGPVARVMAIAVPAVIVLIVGLALVGQIR